jgi:hypothetical protein
MGTGCGGDEGESSDANTANRKVRAFFQRKSAAAWQDRCTWLQYGASVLAVPIFLVPLPCLAPCRP